ncbi:penicillin amidase [Rubricella aquisinus]|uniref:Penicillin amidase n=2 Tax=Rubricella aquisinus TaxID=2028108 RepID=A0A840WKX9_9RHOB|nr:penicillin amidase [Rubricella aquisinus]
MALLAIGIGVVYYLAAGSLPEYDATVEVDGLNGPVEIVRDLHAVPHIFGETDEDVFFGLGYAHAQDRLWQMTMLRRTAQGRLSELFGEATVEIDHLLRALDIYGVAQAMVPNQSPETQSAMRAYAAGVNARLREVQAEALGRGAPEFFLFGAEIAPWTPADSIAVNRIMALQLTDHASRETLRAELSLLLSPERLDDIQPLPPLPPDLERPDFSSLFPEVMPTRDAQPPVAPLFAALNPVHEVGSAGASNAWAAAPSRSASGATVMASDPHLGLSAPSIWMLARLEFPGSGGVIGGTIPGLPGILIGRNADFGWGLTTSYMDDQDVYIERIDPNDPTQYITPTGSQKFRSRDILINVKGAPARQVTLRWTRHGPVIPGDHYRAADITPPGHVAALAWTALDPNDRSMDTLMGLMRARSIAEGRLALRPLISPPQNVIMADREDVALQVMGKMPHRRDTHVGQGRIPVPGWVEENDWLGYLPFDDNPRVLSPDSGMVINTNNRTTDAPFPRHMSFSWGDSQRIGRAQRLLGQREFHTPESFIDAQTDIVSPTARTLLPLIGRDLWWQDGTGPEDRLTPLRKTALERLAEWNGEMSEHRPEPLVYAMWVRALQIRLMRDELGPVADRLDRVEALFIERAFLDIDGAAAWCDVVTSRAVETCQDMAALALDDALDTLSAQYGNRVESWRWGEAHRAFHEHQVLGGIPVLSFFANIVQPTSGGDNTLMRGRTRGEDPDPFTNVHGSALRVIYDFGDPEGSRYIISTGQSGHMLSRHYDDLATLWRRGDYIPMSLDPERARADAIGVTRLVPR